jgi:hypothetical protein
MNTGETIITNARPFVKRAKMRIALYGNPHENV